MFVAATNTIDLVDEALLRRFDFTLEIENPDADLRLRMAALELDPSRTPGTSVAHLAERISKLNLKNLYEVVGLCRRIRRDLVLNEGRGIEALLTTTPKHPVPAQQA